MSHEMIIAMNVVHEERYGRYRAAMRPILEEYEGGFRHDFRVSETLRGELGHDVTRIFAIYFRTLAASEAFFRDPRYLAAKERHFDGAVDGFTVLATHDPA